ASSTRLEKTRNAARRFVGRPAKWKPRRKASSIWRHWRLRLDSSKTVADWQARQKASSNREGGVILRPTPKCSRQRALWDAEDSKRRSNWSLGLSVGQKSL